MHDWAEHEYVLRGLFPPPVSIPVGETND